MNSNREYEVHLLLTAPDVVPWRWETWQRIAERLDPIVNSATGKPATYSRQIDNSTKRLRGVSFGRMTWGAQHHEKWTHDSPKTSGASVNWEFVDTQVWVPSRTVCQREHKRPDIYFQVLNGAIGSTKPVRFSSVLLLAVAIDLPETLRFNANRTITALAEELKAKLRLFKLRHWARPFGPLMVVDSMCDSDTWLFRVGPRHSEEPSLSLFREEWELKALTQ